MESLPRSRSEARALGEKFYFTGKPCKNGHVARRYASTATCVECDKERSREWHQDNPEYAKKASREWRQKNPEYAKEINRNYRQNNPERVKKAVQNWRQNNLERERENSRKWTQNNRGKVRAYINQYRTTKKNARPRWADKEKIDSVFQEAMELKEAGINAAVDHIVPLNGGNVSGLDVEYNLQIITKSENSRKSNHHDPLTHVHDLPEGEWSVTYHTSVLKVLHNP